MYNLYVECAERKGEGKGNSTHLPPLVPFYFVFRVVYTRVARAPPLTSGWRSPLPDPYTRLHRGQTPEVFVLFRRVLFNIKWRHGQGCIK